MPPGLVIQAGGHGSSSLHRWCKLAARSALVFLLVMSSMAAATELESGEAAFARGAIKQAIEKWQLGMEELSPAEQLARLLKLGDAHANDGALTAAAAAFTRAIQLATAAKDDFSLVAALTGLSDALMLGRQLDEAKPYLNEALSVAARTQDDTLLASALNQLGVWQTADEDFEGAIDTYRSALDKLRAGLGQAVRTTLLVNLVRTATLGGDAATALAYIDEAFARGREIPSSREQAFTLIGLAGLAAQLTAEPPTTAPPRLDRLRATAFGALEHASTLARENGDKRALTFAVGQTAEFYLQAGRHQEAETLFLKARFIAAEMDVPEALARWQWRLGEIALQAGRLDDAQSWLHNAVENLERIESAVVLGRRGSSALFSREVRPVYLALAKLYLNKFEHAQQLNSADKSNDLHLREARNVMERLKAIELKNYFRDGCVTRHLDNNPVRDLDSLLVDGTATIYPIVFADTAALILTLPNGVLSVVSIEVSARELRATVGELRLHLRPGGNTRRFRRASEQLHRWLIEPVLATLREARIDTLVIVPDAALRLLPLAALHDGKRYLVEEFATATVPGLRLLNPRPFTATAHRALMAGLTEPVQGFTPLLHVGTEIEAVARLFAGRQLLNNAFTTSKLDAAMQQAPYSILSLATHSRFERDPRRSFLLTYDGRMSLDGLESLLRLRQIRDEPLELLVLSACDTADGDERAAMGLAGVGVKSGARTVLASLWSVNDQSTGLLIPAFFAELANGEASRAKALQSAQLKLLQDAKFANPYHWAAFVLIGNWL